jgi:signal transduction histidine kinase/DNA-binding NarL/FixJ family response regulator
MKINSAIQLPFLFIIVLSSALIAVILFTRNQADISIKQLQAGNHEAIRVFKGNQLLDEIINGLFIAQTGLKKTDTAAASAVTGSLKRVKAMAASLDSLFIQTEIDSATSVFNSLVQQQVSIFENRSDANIPAQQQLTDSIFISGVELEEMLGTYLQQNISGNEKLATRVLRLDIILTVIIIITIAVLATIIIRYLFSNIQLLRAVQEQQTEIENSANIKQQFLANMSHEIRTPVNAVIGFTGLLQKTPMTATQENYVNTIKNAAENLLVLVNDILDISKIEAGMMQFYKSPFSVYEVCYHLETLLFQNAVQKNLDIQTFIDDDVPEVVSGDRERLIQILMNLISNAIKFTQKGSIAVSVKVAEKNDKSVKLHFSVKDTGIGIHPEKQKIIFERFEQAETNTTRKYGGTGLGLSIVKNLVEQQGGTVQVMSEEGAGSDFFFTITYEKPESGIAGLIKSYNKNALPNEKETTQRLKGINVLAAEDNKMNQLLLTKLFEQWGVQADMASDGKEAIEKALANNYDLILMDIHMPVMDGYEAAGKLKQQLKSACPVFAMTANVMAGEKEKCMQAGMNGYIAKPVNDTELFSLLLLHHPGFSQQENYVDAAYLHRIFNGNRQHIAELVKQFVQQYPSELQKLREFIDARNIASVKKTGHFMKTTVCSVNNKSALLFCLEAIENADNSETGWNIILYNFKVLEKHQAKVMEQAESILNAL